MVRCAVLGCHSDPCDTHHIWSGNGNRVPCVFQATRKSGTPGGVIHEAGCKCNEIHLCRKHHTLAHHNGDEWLAEKTLNDDVIMKVELTRKD